MVIAGVMLLDGQQRACLVRVEQTAEQAFALEARRFSPQPIPPAEPATLRLSGPNALPVNSIFRLLAELMLDRSSAGDLEWTLLGLSLAPTIDPTTVTATIRLRAEASDANSIRIDFFPVKRRSIEFTWSSDCPVERWLRALRRAANRCPLAHPVFVD
jgi:hypothetical protein